MQMSGAISMLHAPVGGLAGVHDAADDDEVDEAAQALVAAEPLDEAGQVLHAVQAGHGEQHRLVLVLRAEDCRLSSCVP